VTDGPSSRERYLVYRCLLTQGVLIGDEDEVWTHPSADRALVTLRLCVDAIRMLYRGGHGVQASYLKALVMQEDGLDGMPFALDEMAEFLVEDVEARNYWDSRMADDRWPHVCPFCGGAAYVGYLQVECKGRCPQSKTR
jgi:hypothetical protein